MVLRTTDLRFISEFLCRLSSYFSESASPREPYERTHREDNSQSGKGLKFLYNEGKGFESISFQELGTTVNHQMMMVDYN